MRPLGKASRSKVVSRTGDMSTPQRDALPRRIARSDDADPAGSALKKDKRGLYLWNNTDPPP